LTSSAKLREGQIEQALAISRRAGKSLHDVIMGRRPPGIEGLGLSTALRQHAAAFEARTGILTIVLAKAGKETLSPAAKDALIRICLEALNNIVKHADANTVHVTLETRLRETVLGIEDDGRGFDTAAVGDAGAQTGAGLPIMRERALAIRARFLLYSAPNNGTRIEIAVPQTEV
jgi:signal transduction histidine kinase